MAENLDISLSSLNIAENWSILPNPSYLTQYLNSSTILQLSQVNKYYRSKLSSQVFQKIELFKGGIVIPGKPNLSSRKKQLEILAGIMIDELGDKSKFIKELIIYDTLTSRFCQEFFTVFNNIEKLSIWSDSSKSHFSHIALATMINLLKNLKSVEFDSNILNQYEFEKIETQYKLSTNLRKIKVIQKGFEELHFELLERMDSTYTELVELTVFNNRMLTNIQFTYPKLTKLEFLPYAEFRIDYVINLIYFNQNLVSLTIPYNILNSKVIESILSLKKLLYYKISYPADEQFQVDSLTINNSIEHLNLYTYIPGKVLIPILNSLKCLKTLEFSNYNFEDFSEIPWILYNSKIPRLLLNGLINCHSNVDYLVPLDKFDIIEFYNIYNLSYFYRNDNFKNLRNWMVKEGTEDNVRDFILVKKNK